MQSSSFLNIAIEMVALGAPDSWDQDEEIGRLKSMRRALLLLCAALTHSAPQCGRRAYFSSCQLSVNKARARMPFVGPGGYVCSCAGASGLCRQRTEQKWGHLVCITIGQPAGTVVWRYRPAL